jgi:DNA helicase-2/ATP-dependent DNA helicase PcrA
VARLILGGCDPSGILLLTFTRKAAAEMIGRCEELAGPGARLVQGGTFHSFAGGVLQDVFRQAGRADGFGILDPPEAERLMGLLLAEISGESGISPDSVPFMRVIDYARNMGIGIKDAVARRAGGLAGREREIEEAAARYAREKGKLVLMDFDDLLTNLLFVLESSPAACAEIAGRFTHVLIDEYQDTNPIQARIALKLSSGHGNVTAVGDDAQAIYGFRGADVNNIRNFTRMFPSAAVVKLEDNYRSLGTVVDFGNTVLMGADVMVGKSLRAVRGGGGSVARHRPEDTGAEAEAVISWIRGLAARGAAPGEMAVLYRNNADAATLIKALKAKGIDFSKPLDDDFLERGHVRDIVAFLKLSRDPSDERCLERIILLHEGMDLDGARSLAAWAAADPSRLAGLGGGPAGRRGGEAVAGLGRLLSDVVKCGDALRRVMPLVAGYYKDLMQGFYRDWAWRSWDVDRIAVWAGRYATAAEFLASGFLNPMAAQAKGGPGKGVSLSTIHSAKGLEWRHVCILSVVDGSIPSYHSIREGGPLGHELLEEERRIFYVGVTRAKDTLTLMCPAYTVTKSGKKWHKEPSRFLPPEGQRRGRGGR